MGRLGLSRDLDAGSDRRRDVHPDRGGPGDVVLDSAVGAVRVLADLAVSEGDVGGRLRRLGRADGGCDQNETGEGSAHRPRRRRRDG